MNRLLGKLCMCPLAGIIILGMLISCSGRNSQKEKQETAGAWISLFDGETLTGWKRYNTHPALAG